MPQTPDGKIDFSGVWDFRTTTPLQAPVYLNNSEGFSEDEAAKFEVAAQEAWDVRVFGEPWSDRGRYLTEGLRASLIIESLDGRLPPRTPYGQSLNLKWRKLMDASTTVNP